MLEFTILAVIHFKNMSTYTQLTKEFSKVARYRFNRIPVEISI